jgi:hypothetical protein
MFSFPIQILPADVAAETAALNEKLAKGISNLTNLTDDDIDIGSTPKDVVLAQDGIKVYHYHALVEPGEDHENAAADRAAADQRLRGGRSAARSFTGP